MKLPNMKLRHIKLQTFSVAALLLAAAGLSGCQPEYRSRRAAFGYLAAG